LPSAEPDKIVKETPACPGFLLPIVWRARHEAGCFWINCTIL
jgi:hypothetical protein